MNPKMLEVLQRHVVTSRHVRISHSHLKSFPSQILVPNEVLRCLGRRLRCGRRLDYGQDLHGWIFGLRIKDLDVFRLMNRSRRRLNVFGLGRLMFDLFLPAPAGKIPQVNSQWQVFFFSHLRTGETKVVRPAQRQQPRPKLLYPCFPSL